MQTPSREEKIEVSTGFIPHKPWSPCLGDDCSHSSHDLCTCGHERNTHAEIPFSPNYTEGRCKYYKCSCQHFNIKS